MKFTLTEKIVYSLGCIALILLSPIFLVGAVLKTIFTFLKGGFEALKD